MTDEELKELIDDYKRFKSFWKVNESLESQGVYGFIKAVNKASTETLKLIELALENKLAFIYLKGVRDLMDSAIKEIGNKYDG